ncbi:hypothetical protein RhiirC2_768673 [Rhizophagus irregularis]|uniref:Uncharacterized protein n=1 Tax=Rhizophagus irregularis TaxID=588596 RepID=A0A2N1P193_9GLOM|nr:hypothetical protein RhiirC2_768673 [Rhizophagus irregularis]
MGNFRGVYNDNINKLSYKKEVRVVIKNLWNFVYEEFKQRIWIPRCDEIMEIERKEEEKLEKIEKNKITQSIKKVTLNRLTVNNGRIQY